MTELRLAQVAFLQRLETEGPILVEITPSSPRWLQFLWDKGLIERHNEKRFRITDVGRRALDEHVEATR